MSERCNHGVDLRNPCSKCSAEIREPCVECGQPNKAGLCQNRWACELRQTRVKLEKAEQARAGFEAALKDTYKALCGAWRAVAEGDPVGTAPALAARLEALFVVAGVSAKEANRKLEAIQALPSYDLEWQGSPFMETREMVKADDNEGDWIDADEVRAILASEGPS